jgi:3-oxoadipate enol-lactonase
MWTDLTVNVLMALAWLALLTVPQAEYRRKVADIPSMEEKNRGLDLLGWTYDKIHSDSLTIDHYFYHFPSVKPGAPVMLFLHGLNLDGKTFARLKPLADSYDLIAYDFPESTPLYRGQADDFVNIVGDFLRIKGIDTCVLCGISAGGTVAVKLVASLPQIHVSHLILLSSELSNGTGMSPATQRRTVRLAESLPDYKLYRLIEMFYNRFETQGTSRPDSLAHLIDLRVKQPSWYRQVFRAQSGYNESADCRLVRCPTLVLNGSKDRVATPERGRKLAEAIPGAIAETVQGAGHAIPVTHAEFTVERIRRFLHSGT